jgi:hypothetical protein
MSSEGDGTKMRGNFLKGRKTMKTLPHSWFSRFVLPCMTATLVLLAAGIAHADSIYTVTIAQAGANVVATGSGTIDLTGLTSFGSAYSNNELYPDHGILGTGPSGTVDLYSGSSGPATFGPGSVSFPSSTSGDSVFLEDFGLSIEVPQGYVSGASLSSGAVFDSATIASLGLMPGTYTWTWDSGANSFVLEVEKPTVVQEPSSFVLMGIGLLAGLGLMRKRMFGHAARG